MVILPQTTPDRCRARLRNTRLRLITRDTMMDLDEETTKYAKGAKREAKLLLKDDSHKQCDSGR